MAGNGDDTQTDSPFRGIEDMLDTARLYHRAGRYEEAEDLYWQAMDLDNTHPEPYHLLGMIALQAGKLDPARELMQTAQELDDANPVYHANMGTVHYQAGDYEQAEAAYRRAIELDPNYAEAQFNLGILLKEQGRYWDAVEPLDEAARLKPEAKSFAPLAEVLIRLDHYEQADEVARAAIKLRPQDRAEKESLVRALQGLGRPREALRWAKELEAEAPDVARYHQLLAGTYLEAGMPKPASTEARRAYQLNPTSPGVIQALAQTLMAGIDWDEALEMNDRGLELAPDNEALIAQRANILEHKGRLKEAYEAVRPLIKDRKQFQVGALNVFANVAKEYGAEEEAANLLANCLNSSGLPKGVQMGMYFQLGGLLDKIGRYDEAIQAYHKANQLKPRSYSRQANENNFQRIKAQYTEAFFERAPRATHGSRRPVFIVGMPRSGTSLTEQILASHPQVHGAGELEDIGTALKHLPGYLGSERAMPEAMAEATREGLDRGAQDYLDRLAELAPAEAQRVTDKMPQNFLHLGAMALMFPEATFIHTRRDPRDTCLSCYFQNFVAQGLTFAYDLSNLGHYYALYEDLMAHWHQVLPVSIYDLQYEELVADPETKVAELLAHCGLEWDDRCMRFFEHERDTRTASYDQVRKPIYTSSAGRWQRYADHIGPLVEELGLEGREA